jgi:hypothetical protein
LKGRKSNSSTNNVVVVGGCGGGGGGCGGGGGGRVNELKNYQICWSRNVDGLHTMAQIHCQAQRKTKTWE